MHWYSVSFVWCFVFSLYTSSFEWDTWSGPTTFYDPISALEQTKENVKAELYKPLFILMGRKELNENLRI